MNLKQRSQKISEQFSGLQSWEDRYKKIIDMGKKLPEMPEELKIEDYKVRGCQSQVWLHARLNDHGQIIFQGDSDALLVRGLVAMLLEIYSGVTPQEIITTQPDFLKDIGFEGNLSPSRANGLFSMIKQIRYYATAFAMLKGASQS